MYAVVDFETFYEARKNLDGTPAYSLRNFTPPEYIHHPKWECHGCAVALGDDGPVTWVKPDGLPALVAEWRARQRAGEKITLVSHNALFDMAIMLWVYGFLPDLMIDTLGMSRALVYAYTGEASLEAVAVHLSLPPKGGALPKVAGKRLAQIEAEGLLPEYMDYGMHDAWLCREIFKRLRTRFPAEEFLVMDMVLRCGVVPRFQADVGLLHEHAANIAAHKQALLARCGLASKDDLMSNEKFAQALRMLGVEPPTKPSPTNPQVETYAFAKSDPAMIELEEHESDAVQALVAARLGHKSTLEETRTNRLIAISQITWKGKAGAGWLPVPLRYAGAHTHRLSGEWKINAQNWPKVTVAPDGTKEKGRLRRAHRAPDNKKVVKADASQIEARFVAWLAGQSDLVDAFREGRDIYSEFATDLYGYPVSKALEEERFVGKNGILGLGFGVGSPKFRKELAAKSYVTLGRSIILEPEFADKTVRTYRERYHHIPSAWRWWQDRIPLLQRGDAAQFGPVTIEKEIIRLPNGMPLFYHGLHQRVEGGKLEWWCKYGKRNKRIYGGKLYENIVQALARIATMQAALRVQKRMPLAHQVHDDLVYVVPDAAVSDFRALLEEEMSMTPAWAPGLPLACESAVGQNYGDAR